MRHRGWLTAGAFLLGSSLLSQPGLAQPAGAAPPVAAAQPTGAQPSDRQQLLLAIAANGTPLSNGVVAYQDDNGSIYLPIGELAHLLGFGLSVDPSGNSAKGSGNAAAMVVDVAARSVTSSKGSRILDAAAFQSAPGEIFVRVDVLEEMFGFKVKTDLPGLQVNISSGEPLPFEEVLRRQQMREQLMLANPADKDLGPVREAPYRLITPPAIDVQLTADLIRGKYSGRNELRAAGDLLFGGYQLFVNTDGHFRHPNLRFTIDRRDLDGEYRGMTRIAAGDVFTPALMLGPRSNAGRGLTLTNEPYQSVGIFDKLDLRGELAAGWEVELYVNELLTGYQKTPSNGQYEFLNVPLVYGQNALRLRFYGPNGEQRDEVRHFTVGGGQVPEGHLVYNMGVVLDGRPLFDIGDEQSAFVGRVKGLNGAGNIRYGLTRWLTLTGGIGTYEPKTGSSEQRFVGTIGARTALGPFSIEVQGALDDSGGKAASAAIAGPLPGGSIIARHTEYADGFIDQVGTGPGGDRARKRSTDVRLNEAVRIGQLILPISLQFAFDVLSDGTPIYSGQLRTSLGWQNARLSLGMGYRKEAGGYEELTGSADVYLMILDGWRLRGGLLAQFMPEGELRAVQFSAERAFGLNKQVSFGFTHNFGAYSSTTVDGSLLLRAPFFDFSVNANYDFKKEDFRIGGQLAFGFVHDPLRGRYLVTRPGVTTTGSLALDAFQDLNGDGLRQQGEPGVRGVSVNTGSYFPAQTNDDGYAFAPGMGTGLVPVQVSAQAADDLLNVPADLKFRAGSRPGRVIVVNYPIVFESDVAVRPVLRGPSGLSQEQALAGIRLVLVSHGGQRFVQTTAEDGFAYFTHLPAGEYRVEIDAGQGAWSNGRITSSTPITAPPEGGSLLPVQIEIKL